MIFFSKSYYKPLKIFQTDAVGDLVWRTVVKSGVHAAAYQACAPQLGSLKQKSSGKEHFDA
jgi:Na+/H+ antiporter NhaA